MSLFQRFPVPRRVRPHPTVRSVPRAWLVFAVLLASLDPPEAKAAVPANAPQVLLAVTNSSSMDGTTDGAIFVGSGQTGETFFNTTSSPTNYTIPSGFTPPLRNNGDGTAPYTYTCPSNSNYQCDNGPSRLNMTKAAIQSVLTSYGNVINFGIYDYKALGTITLYDTWVYYMSPTGGAGTFGFTSTSGSNTVANPCYQYTTKASGTAYSNCQWIDNHYSASVTSSAYMTISDTSDNAVINDVLYVPTAFNYPDAFIVYNGPTPATPYTFPNSLTAYNAGTVAIGYGAWTYNNNTAVGWSTSPTNAGYVAYTKEVFYALRGYGYNAAVSNTTGNLVVPMGTAATDSKFSTALAPETNNASSGEIKAVAAQSPIAGLMKGALGYLQGLSKTSCQAQYVVLMTDGLPTLDLSGTGKAWPPLGTASASGYGVQATYNADGSLNVAGTNDQAMIDAVAQITNLRNAGIKTYVIGLGAGVNATANTEAVKALTAMAIAGGTSTFYAANSQSSLSSAFAGIINQIYSAASIAAPIAPLSVASGSGFEYALTSNPTPSYGSVSAYATTAAGVAAGSPSWDAATLMTSAGRTASLYSTAANGSTITTLSSLDAAAFNLTTTSCIGSAATIVNYTVNPSYSGVSSCSFLAGRASGSFLGTFSGQNQGLYVGPPANSALINDSSYLTYASASSGRTALLMFSNNDGFLYAVNASTGALQWGWMPRNVVRNLQNYASFQSNQYLNGGFRVVDAKDAGGNWASYVVGSAQSGAEHFSVKLTSSGGLSAVVYDSTVSGATSPGDAAVTVTGATPQHQTPQIAWLNGSAYALYVQNSGGQSTFYEVNVATGAATSATLTPLVSSAMSYVDQSGVLWFGSSAGGLYSMPITGNAANDAALLLQVGTVPDPANPGSVVANVLYVGYTELKGVPYAYAMSPAQITVFSVGTQGWNPVWAATPTTGYLYTAGSFSASATVNTLQTGSVNSDTPLLVNGALVVPQFVGTSSCGSGSGYYGFFDLQTGKFPTVPFAYMGSTLADDLRVGSGPAFTPSVVVTNSGVILNPGTAGLLAPASSLSVSGTVGPGVAGWRPVLN